MMRAGELLRAMFGSTRWVRSRGFGFLSVLSTSASAISCRSGAPSGFAAKASSSPSRLDRMAAAYPDLRAGRYAIIADFEDPTHVELFRAMGTPAPRSGAAFTSHVEARTRGGRAETGSGCLSATILTPEDAIVINSDHATQWALKRDWHDYDLLLLAVHSPSANVDVSLTVRSGAARAGSGATEEPSPRPSPLKGEGGGGSTVRDGARELAARKATTRQRLERGWNLLRLDLADLGEHVALDDVREIRISADAPKWPLELRLDDIILTASRTRLFGDAEARDGKMFTYQQGRRYHIGAGGKFELVFGNGQIVGWYDLAADPRRIRNLWDGMMLGFAQPGGANRAGADSDPGIVVSSKLREANVVRCVLVVEVRAQLPAPTDTKGLVYRWTYDIYPTGKIYTSVEFGPRMSTAFADPPLLRVTKAREPRGKFDTIFSTIAPRAGEDLHQGAFAPQGASANMAIVATIPIDETTSGDRRSIVSDDGLGFGPTHPEQFDRTRPWLLRLAHCDHSLMGEDPTIFAEWFEGAETFSLVARGGKAVSETVGFDGGAGTYRVNAKGESIRIELGTGIGWFDSPGFVVAETPGTDAWVYANSKLVTPTARDADGNLIFQLPGVVREKTVVEVLFDQQGATAPK